MEIWAQKSNNIGELIAKLNQYIHTIKFKLTLTVDKLQVNKKYMSMKKNTLIIFDKIK
jgi:hypothetical protein